MKKYFYLLLMVVSMGFVSCSSDDDGPDGEAAKFIGGWSSSGDREILFCPDGTCKFHEWCEWNYDKSTKQLATTRDGESWVISLVTDIAWTGVSAKKGKSVSFQRDNARFLECFYYLMDTGDAADAINKQEEAILKAKRESNPYYFPMTERILYASNNDIKIESTSIKATNVEYKLEDQTIFKGTITINNYGKKNAKMTMVGTIVPTNEQYNKEFSAREYVRDENGIYKDGKDVSVNE